MMKHIATLWPNVGITLDTELLQEELTYGNIPLFMIGEPTDEMIDAACEAVPGLYRVDAMRAIEAALAALISNSSIKG